MNATAMMGAAPAPASAMLGGWQGSPAAAASGLSQYEKTLVARGFRVIRAGHSSTHRGRIDLVRGLVSRGVGLLVGAPGSAKTLLALDLSMHLVTGRPWLGRRTRRIPVVYMATEDGEGVERRALALATEEFGLTDLPDGLTILDGPINLTDATSVSALVEALKDKGRCGLLVIDTLANACAGLDENSAKDMTLAMEVLARIYRLTDWTVMVLHHTPKTSDGRRPVARGSGHIFGRAEFELGTRKDSTTGEVVLSVGKMKDGSTSDDVAAFRIEPVHIDDDDEGEAIAPPIVRLLRIGLPSSLQARAPVKPTKGDSRREALEASIERLVGESSQVGISAVRAEFYARLDKAEPGLTEDTRKKAYQTAERASIERGFVIKCDDGKTLALSEKREREVQSGKFPALPDGRNREEEAGREHPLL